LISADLHLPCDTCIVSRSPSFASLASFAVNELRFLG
jgi:hypothetical protein